MRTLLCLSFIGLVLISPAAAQEVGPYDEPGEQNDDGLNEPNHGAGEAENAGASAQSSTDPKAEEVVDWRALLEAIRALDPAERDALLQQLLVDDQGRGERVDVLLEEGLAAFERGAFEEAAERFAKYSESYPKQPTAVVAKRLELIARKNSSRGPVGVAGELAAPRAEEHTSAIEYVSLMTSYGVWTGIAGSVVFELDDASALFTSGCAAAALAGSLYYAWDRPITSAEAAVAENGVLWMTWNGIALMSITGVELDERKTMGFTWLSSTAGLALGLLIPTLVSVDDGAVAMVNSGGLWGTFLAGMIVFGFANDASSETIMAALLAGTDLGLTAMAIVASYTTSSRGRQVLIDLGGIVGALMGAGVLGLSVSEDTPTELAASVMILTAGGGIALAAWMTRSMKNDKEEPVTGLLAPAPFVTPNFARDGQLGFNLGVNLLNVVY